MYVLFKDSLSVGEVYKDIIYEIRAPFIWTIQRKQEPLRRLKWSDLCNIELLFDYDLAVLQFNADDISSSYLYFYILTAKNILLFFILKNCFYSLTHCFSNYFL